MRYLLAAAGALLLAHTIRYITGNVAGLCTLLSVGLWSTVYDRRPALFLVLACCIWAGVRLLRDYSLKVLSIVPAVALAGLLLTNSSTVPAIGLCLADLIAIVSLAYRGWTNKRLLD